VNLVFSSALEEANVQPLVDALTQRISTISANEEGQELFLSRERHVHLLSEAIESLNNAFQGSFDSAIAAHNLRDAIEYIGEISGSVVNERILDEIFSQFCIGK
jgi:tRNA modification GTPase